MNMGSDKGYLKGAYLPTSVFNILKKKQDPEYRDCIESLSHKTNDKQVKEVLKQSHEGLKECSSDERLESCKCFEPFIQNQY